MENPEWRERERAYERARRKVRLSDAPWLKQNLKLQALLGRCISVTKIRK